MPDSRNIGELIVIVHAHAQGLMFRFLLKTRSIFTRYRITASLAVSKLKTANSQSRVL